MNGNIVYALVICLIGLWSATQVVAWKLGNAASLGGHLGGGLYLPWQILLWAGQGYSQAPRLFMGAIGAGVLCIAFLLMGMLLYRRAENTRSKGVENLHGSARWAERNELAEAGFLNQQGVFLGGWIDPKTGRRDYLRYQGTLHVLVLAPTRSGKGVCLVMPTLLTWQESAVVTDLKGELWAMSAGWRQRYAKQKTLRFEPARSGVSIKWNPLDEIRLHTDYEIADAQNLALMLADPSGKGKDGSSRHWIVSSESLLTGLILYMLYRREKEGTEASFGAIDKFLSESQTDDSFWTQLKNEQIHPVVSQTAQDMLNTPEKERGSIISTTRGHISLWRDKVVCDNTAASEFHIDDLMNHDQPVTLYIITQPTDKERIKPLSRILINMICRRLAASMHFEKQDSGTVRASAGHKRNLLMLLDEFASLGRLEIIQESLAFLGGFGIVFYLIVQDIEQVIDTYGEHQTITSNTHIKIAFSALEQRTVQYLCKMIGQTTILKEQITTSGQRLGFFEKQVSRTYQEISRPLMTEDEIRTMPKAVMRGDIMIEGGDMLVFMAGISAIYGKQLPYFLDPALYDRACIAPPEKTDILCDATLPAVSLQPGVIDVCAGKLPQENKHDGNEHDNL